MNERQTRDIRTITVICSQPMARPDGRAAIRPDARELGSIALIVDERAIEGLRQAVAASEVTHPSGPESGAQLNEATRMRS